jgi:hypothetical protein
LLSVKKEEISVKVENNVLTHKRERKIKEEVKKRHID